MMDVRQKIWAGIADMLAGHNTNDDKRFRRGQDIVKLALDTIPSPWIDPDLLWELHQAGVEMCETAIPELDVRAFLQVRERFQIALSKIRGEQ